MATYSAGKKWFDYEFEVSKLDLNDPVPIREQWDALSEEDRYEEYLHCCDTARDCSLVSGNLKAELGILEMGWNILRLDLHERSGRSIIETKKRLDAKLAKEWEEMSAPEQWETFICYLEFVELLEVERQELLRLAGARRKSEDPDYTMPLEAGYNHGGGP